MSAKIHTSYVRGFVLWESSLFLGPFPFGDGFILFFGGWGVEVVCYTACAKTDERKATLT